MILRKKYYIFLFICMFLPALKCNAAETVSGGDVVIETSPEINIPVTELDFGDCPRKLMVGTSQMINVLAIPADATDVRFTYKTDNPEIASINALGRLTGNNVGTVQITVSCGEVSGKFWVTVTEDTSNIPVQDIELEEVEKELKVDSKINIRATVLPVDATDSKITYHSSDVKIATVNSSGQVIGIAPGQVTIEVRAGNVVKEIPLIVKVGTSDIQLNREYLILKPEETFQMEVQVQPKEAPSKVKYKSLNTDVVTVSSKGLITAKSSGNTVVVVSNDDLQVTVSVIVNTEGETKENEDVITVGSSGAMKFFPDRVDAKDYPNISSEMLKYLYEKDKLLTVECEGYVLYIDGNKIVNFDNQMETQLRIQEEQYGFSFVVNGGNDLCGRIIIDLSDKITDQKYLYLYNEAKQEYEQIKVDNISWLSIDSGGKYLVVSQRLTDNPIDGGAVVWGCIAVIIVGGGYVSVKRKYWFW